MTIHCVWEIRRRPERGGFGAGADATAAVICSTIRGETRRLAPQRGVAVAVQEVEHQANQQPPAEPLPCLARQTPHHEDASGGAAKTHRPDEWDTEGTRTRGLCM